MSQLLGATEYLKIESNNMAKYAGLNQFRTSKFYRQS